MTPQLRPTPMLRTALLVVAAIVVSGGGTAVAETHKVGDRASELDVAVDAKGKPFKLKSYRGKWLVITVGADWCKPCAKELPTWDKVAGELAGKVTFVAIDIDDEIAVGKKFHDKLKLKNMTRVYLPNDKSTVGGNYGGDTMPTSMIIDPQGVVRFVKKGFETADANGEAKKLREQIAKLTAKS